VDNLLRFGLFRFDDERRRLSCAPIVFFLLGSIFRDEKISKALTHDYNGILHHFEDDHAPNCQRPRWEQWQEFNSIFRALKAELYGNDATGTTIRELHQGSVLNLDANLDAVKLLASKNVRVVTSMAQLSTKGSVFLGHNQNLEISKSMGDVEKINAENGDVVVVNAAAADSGDAVVALVSFDRKMKFVEAHQYKLERISRYSLDSILSERTKAADKNDFFIMLTTSDYSLDASKLPPNTGIVTKKQFSDYYGSFSARAYWLSRPLNANKAAFLELQTVRFLGPKKAKKIVDEREAHGDYKNIEDLHLRTHIGKNILADFVEWT